MKFFNNEPSASRIVEELPNTKSVNNNTTKAMAAQVPINIFLVILSFILLGKDKTKATILGSMLFPLFVKLTEYYNNTEKESIRTTCADLLGLSNRVTHLPNELSGGQQQRVSIGRALLSKPSVILADEPTGNLDSKNSKEIMALLKTANENYKQTIIMVTHDKELAKYANRIITIEDGKIARDEVGA